MLRAVECHRTAHYPTRFIAVLTRVIVPRQFKSSMKSLQKYIDEGPSPLEDEPPEAFALLMADQLETVRAGGKGITFDFSILILDWVSIGEDSYQGVDVAWSRG